MELILASQSPRRAQLLGEIGLQFSTCIPDVDETPHPAEPPVAYVERLAQAKARRGFAIASADRAGGESIVVLGADTIVVVSHNSTGDEILGKPGGPTETMTMLAKLSGRAHQVHTGVAVTDGERCESTVVTSTVHFRTLSAAEMQAYCDTGEGADKAGSYGIQGIGGIFVERIEGSFSGVMGLPVLETETLLQMLNVDTWSMRDQWLKSS